ncbi:ferritin-like domain-containing protein [Paraburkholderia sp. BCC1886]|uniref:ferritin-like domain-containing protein n=1 Tax=Paraburkholderia sp. BCC1886 TaxID=2562670 RepID=UPI001182CD14|nr:ferritin-like domain-containing protein [Paraburkholderia sp. BCC1886]
MSVASSFTILDAPVSQFPLDLDVRIPKIRELFHLSTSKQWDPRVDIDWEACDPSIYTEEQRYAGRLSWSRRAWTEYAAISESPALQVRFCHEKRAPDMRLYFTIRSQEESRHAESCFRMAERLGGYIEAPKPKAQQSVATHGVRRMALDPSMPLEAIIAALVCTSEEVAFDVFRHLAEITRDPAAKRIHQMITRDEVRHCAFGWRFLDAQMPLLSRAEVKAVEEAVVTMIEKVELNGYHVTWLSPDSEDAREEIAMDRLAWEAGLGATVEELEKPIFIASIRSIRERMRPWGIDLPNFSHPKLGTF